MWFFFLAGGLFLLSIAVYVGIMIFYPEWVGITGKKALEAEASHRGSAESGSAAGSATEAIERLEKIPAAPSKE